MVLVLSDNWAAWVRQSIRHPMYGCWPNPVVAPRLPAGVPRESRTLLFLGRLEEEKGVFVLVEALDGLATRYPALRVVFAGEGDVAALRTSRGRGWRT